MGSSVKPGAAELGAVREALPGAACEAQPDAGREAQPDAGREALPDAGREALPGAAREALPDAKREAPPDAKRASARRAMRRRFSMLWVVHGVTATAHVVVAFAATHWLPTPAAVAVAVAALLATVLRLHFIARDPPRSRLVVHAVDEPLFVHWGACVLGTAFAPLAFGARLLLDAAQRPSPGASAAAAYGAALVLSAWGVWGRRRFVRVARYDVPIAGLPPAFDGFRVVHLSDLHVGGFDDRRRADAWVTLANAERPDLVAVTGDLVTTGDHWYRDVAAALGGLRAPEGVLAVMGNHDQWDEGALVSRLREAGLVVLRNERHAVERGGATLTFAGLADRFTGRDDLPATLAGARDAPVVLLAHYPSFFDEAAARGAALVLSGHTHGGQIGLPPLHDVLNVSAFAGERPRGAHRLGPSTLIVNAGLGTSGPPLRLGIPPEIVVAVLRAA